MRLLIQWGAISGTSKVWRELSEMLDIEPTISDTIALAHRDPEAACHDIFSWWLSGEGVVCTWKELIKNLELMKFYELQLKKTFK